jgi:hypothetical protein
MSDGFSYSNPWSWALNLAPKTLSQNILPGWSFMTINETNSTAPETEQRILTVHSYGRQIGRMMDMLDLLIAAADPKVKNTPAFKDAFKDYAKMRKEIEDAKDKADEVRQDRLLDDLVALKKNDRPAFDALIADLKTRG